MVKELVYDSSLVGMLSKQIATKQKRLLLLTPIKTRRSSNPVKAAARQHACSKQPPEKKAQSINRWLKMTLMTRYIIKRH